MNRGEKASDPASTRDLLNKAFISNQNKENQREPGTTHRVIKSSKTTRLRSTETDVDIATSSNNNAILSTTKKVKITINQKTIKQTTLLGSQRQPLGDVDRNIQHQNTGAIPKNKIVEVVSTTTVRYEQITESKTLYQPESSKPLTPDPITAKKISENQSGVNLLSPSSLHGRNVITRPKKIMIVSPIPANVFTKPSLSAITQGIPRDKVYCSVKKSLLTSKTRSDKTGSTNKTFGPNMCSMEYVEDIILWQIENDRKFLLKKNFLKNNNEFNNYTRPEVINWLIRAQEYLQISATTLFITIRIFDVILYKITVPMSMRQLLGLTILWIVHKYEDITNSLTATKLLALCRNVYCIDQLLSMEKKVLLLIDFDLNFSDVTIYIWYYTLKLTKEENNFVQHCAFYTLECFLLTEDYSTIIPSIMAAAAVCLTLRLIHPNSDYWEKLKNVAGYYTIEEMENLISKMLKQIQKVQDPVYQFRQPFEKYSRMENSQASIFFLRKLIGS